jgi:hypothetical protein
MYRLLEKIPASPKHSRIRQEPPPTKRSLKRGNRPEEPAEGAVDITTVLIRFGRPVTSAGQRNATLMRVAFRVSGGQLPGHATTEQETALASYRACLYYQTCLSSG